MTCEFSFLGKILDATHNYMYVFLIAGAEVVTSSFVLALGNACCIKKKTAHSQAKEDAAEREELNKKPEDSKVDSIEVERFLKKEPEKNGEVVTNPETCV